ncbi:Ras family GTPase [Entamoeba histolytica HM-1:IMSS-B]|uniref:small monomeric GTPase n=6 Tax=Entamoeba histolytica TaxID=5759 RepID=C4M8B7_ENTH1|nr:Ras family GTPase [Entamoeba histolytica HM-1:IMSS]EMD43555.1 Ras family gtpase [Entamoeba histolytica KU27]EMH75132.1 Ras family GTPase [Entamoeba histolytica HM-1:IMSS-B]EMS15475.1 Ras family GTPase [Entamoeba histolytica HM-3:IMSS]ENY62386.1 Ras family GTPase, putative [Entamoeba histolytica HM-1:IMSS-A]GAT97827.1 Ras family GTPase [Entamoeba histolytica]|eukprot:XP_657014.1 Ras family GTPase [Entamoeba histolytica HM-1:IMSS]
MPSVKIVVLGPPCVGKTAVTIRLVNHVFQQQYDPTIEDCFRTTRNLDGIDVCLDILDTAGQDEFVSVKQQYMVVGNGFLILYSIISKQSFVECQSTVEMLLRIRDVTVPWMLIGNKIDLKEEREVTQEDALEYAKQKGAVGFLETSAKSNINIEHAFISLAKQILKVRGKQENQSTKDKKCFIL